MGVLAAGAVAASAPSAGAATITTHLGCNIGSYRVATDVYRTYLGNGIYQVTGIKYNTSPGFHAHQAIWAVDNSGQNNWWNEGGSTATKYDVDPGPFTRSMSKTVLSPIYFRVTAQLGSCSATYSG